MTKTISKQMAKPKIPAWFEELKKLAVAAGWQKIGSPEVIAFKNSARRNKRFGHIVSYDLKMSGEYVFGISWVAHDRKWNNE